jgi:gluconate 2-dehydrogenase gamma chain
MNNRRSFIKGLGATGILLNMPLWQACRQQKFFNGVLSEDQQKTLYEVLVILFPPFQNSPTIDQINTLWHINQYLTDQNIDPDEQAFILNGIKWTDEAAVEQYKLTFNELKGDEKNQIIQYLLEKSWGESWLSRLLTLTFESLLLDPIYKVNLDEVGWQWLQHQPGIPRPNSQNAYPQILKRKQEQITITSVDQL